MQLAQIVWDVNPTITEIGSFQLRYYGILFASGFLLGYQVMAKVFKVENKPEKDLDALLITLILSTVIGARFGHYFFYEQEMLMATPGKFFLEMITPPFAGLASHGAAFGIPFALWLYTRKRADQSFLWITDRVAIIVALAGFFIRFGNLMNSEIVGKPTDVPWAFIFKSEYTGLAEVPRHASQLYEALSCLVLFFILFALWKKYKEKTPNGLLAGIFFIWIFGLRFFYEFLKENQKSFEDTMSLNMGQILSIPAVLFGCYLLYRASQNKKKIA